MEKGLIAMFVNKINDNKYNTKTCENTLLCIL